MYPYPVPFRNGGKSFRRSAQQIVIDRVVDAAADFAQLISRRSIGVIAAAATVRGIRASVA